MIWKTDEVDYQALERLGFRAERDGAAQALDVSNVPTIQEPAEGS